MARREELEKLSKGELIEIIMAQAAMIEKLAERVAELEARD